MNGKKAKKIRRVARTIAKSQVTSYYEVLKHQKMYQQKLTAAEMKRRSTVNENGKFSLLGFLEGGRMMGDVLQTSISVCTRVLEPNCFRAKYQQLKMNWNDVSKNVPELAKV